MNGTRQGMALPLAIVLLLALTILAHGVLLLSRHEVRAASSLRDLVRAQRAAEVGLHLYWAGHGMFTEPAGSSLWEPVSSGDLPGGLSFGVSIHSLDSDFFLLAGSGMVTGMNGGSRIVWLGRSGSCQARDNPNQP